MSNYIVDTMKKMEPQHHQNHSCSSISSSDTELFSPSTFVEENDNNHQHDTNTKNNSLVVFLVLTYITNDLNNIQHFIQRKREELVILNELMKHHIHIANVLNEIYIDLKHVFDLRCNINEYVGRGENIYIIDDQSNEEESIIVKDARMQYETSYEKQINVTQQHEQVVKCLNDKTIQSRMKELQQTIGTLQQLLPQPPSSN